MRSPPTVERLLRWAAILALLGLAFIVWALLDPMPLPVIFSMSVGQVVGTISFALYGLAVALDLRRGGRPPPERDPPKDPG